MEEKFIEQSEGEIANPSEVKDYKKKQLRRGGKNIIRGVGGAGLMVFSTAATLGGPVAWVGGIIILSKGVDHVTHAIRGQYIKDSIMDVNASTGTINQVPSTFKQMAMVRLSKDKRRLVTMQELNFLLQADRYRLKKQPRTGEYKRERIRYNAKSHGFTGELLEKMQEAGYIQNLQQDEIRPRMIILEKLMVGNLRNLFKLKKFYKFSFEITDKEFTEDSLIHLLQTEIDESIENLDDERYTIGRDDQGKIQSINYSLKYLLAERIKGLKHMLGSRRTVKMLDGAKGPEKTKEPEKPKDENLRKRYRVETPVPSHEYDVRDKKETHKIPLNKGTSLAYCTVVEFAKKR